MKYFFLVFQIAFASGIFAQSAISLRIIDSISRQPIIGATVVLCGTTTGSQTDENGLVVIPNRMLPMQTICLTITSVGFNTCTLSQVFDGSIVEIPLLASESNIEEITVVSTRTNARIDDLPTKVEVLGLEELNEENGIKPSNIGSLLGDLSVIHIQQTSSLTGGSSVRMQGLDGKYTQILRDGLPLYDGFSGGLGILQIPPLALRQIEIIKGSVSTLYGGGAISGLINLISKVPTIKPECILTLNQSTLRESNANLYLSRNMGAFGITFFAGSTIQKATDVNHDGMSDVPKVRNLILHPRLFWCNKNNKIDLGYAGTFEQRDGGDIVLLDGVSADVIHQFIEKNKTRRHTFDGHYTHQFSKNLSVNAKSAFSLLEMTTQNIDSNTFAGQFLTSYSDVSLLKTWENNTLVGGVNMVTQSFRNNLVSNQFPEFAYQTIGAYLQDTWKPSTNWTIEGGLRTDRTNQFGSFYLPRLSVLFKPNPTWSIRVGSGSGYRLPDIFTDRNATMIPNQNVAKAEQSLGFNVDANWSHTYFDKLIVTVNQAMYSVRINQPVIVRDGALANSLGSIRTLGTDTYVRLAINPIELYLGYNHTIAQHYTEKNLASDIVFYSPQDKFAMTLAFEPNERWRVGLENAWVGNQFKDDSNKARNYWFLAAMVERKFKKCAIVLNGENLGDFRQSKSEPLFSGTTTNPVFNRLWAPIDGRVINLSLKINI